MPPRRFLGWLRVEWAVPAGPGAAGTPGGRLPGLPAGQAPPAPRRAASRTTRSSLWGLSRTRTNASPPRSVRPGIDPRLVRADAGQRRALTPYPAPERPAQTSGRRRPRWSAVGSRGRRGTQSRPEASPPGTACHWDGLGATEQKVERIARAPREGAEATRRRCAASRTRCRARCGGCGPSTSRASAGRR
jgi:hypothetical protein